jgi:hypothetical protein
VSAAESQMINVQSLADPSFRGLQSSQFDICRDLGVVTYRPDRHYLLGPSGVSYGVCYTRHPLSKLTHLTRCLNVSVGRFLILSRTRPALLASSPRENASGTGLVPYCLGFEIIPLSFDKTMRTQINRSICQRVNPWALPKVYLADLMGKSHYEDDPRAQGHVKIVVNDKQNFSSWWPF